ncbi:hypothetical protein niasHT_018496 [Heterodera trifolii]|uniref:Probable pectate lyase F n=1 Tax=Heterodera trifolii TaxID=157864 RepID=A0ABD2KTY4_9BILA
MVVLRITPIIAVFVVSFLLAFFNGGVNSTNGRNVFTSNVQNPPANIPKNSNANSLQQIVMTIFLDTDFGFTTFVGGSGLLGGGECNMQNEKLKYMFKLADGVTIKNAILDTPGMSIFCRGSCTLDNIYYKRLCFHAAGFEYEDLNQEHTYTVNGGGGIGSPDKYFTQSGRGKTYINGFCGDGKFGKLFCSCGSCPDQVQRQVTISDVRMRGPGLTLVAVNLIYGDQASLSGIHLYDQETDKGVKYICQIYNGKARKNRHPEEDFTYKENGNGPCDYSASQVTLETAGGQNPPQPGNPYNGQPGNQYPYYFGNGASSRLPRPLFPSSLWDSSTFYVCLLISLFVPQIPNTLMLHHNDQIVEIDSKYLSCDPITSDLPAEDDEEKDKEKDDEEEGGYYCKFTVRLEQKERNKCVSRTLDFGEIGGEQEKGKSGPIDERKDNAKKRITDQKESSKKRITDQKESSKKRITDQKESSKKRITDLKETSKKRITDLKDSSKNGPTDQRKDSH